MPAYIGVNGKAKAISKVYKGNSSGKAELIFGPRGMVRSSKAIEELSGFYTGKAAGTIGDYALFAGGCDSSFNYISSIDVYNSSLIKTTPVSLSNGRCYPSMATVGNYTLFAGGEDNSGSSATVDSYTSSLTRTTATNLSIARYWMGSASIGNYALFAGGRCNKNSRVDAYDSSLSRTTASALSVGRDNMASTSVGNYAIFAGGGKNDLNDTLLSTVDAYDQSLTRSTAAKLSSARLCKAATTIGGYALICGGTGTGTSVGSKIIDVYTSSLTKTTSLSLSVERDGYGTSAACVNNYALFAGGCSDYSNIDVFDLSLTRTSDIYLSMNIDAIVATTVGKYALFCGDIWSLSKAIDAYYLWE